MIAPIARVQVKQFFTQDYVPDVLAGNPRTTREQYDLVLDRLEEFGQGPVYLDQLGDKSFLLSYRTWRMTKVVDKKSGRLIAPATVNKDMRLLSAIRKYAYEEEYLTDAPRRIRPLSEPTRDVDAWSTEEMSAQLARAARIPGNYQDIPRGLWWPAMLLTLYDSAGRLSAVMATEWQDYDPASGLLKLRAEEAKQNADNVVRLHEQTRRWLAILAEWRYPLLFPWPWDPVEASSDERKWKTLRRHYRKLILRPCGLPTTRKDMFHRVRRTTITYMWDVASPEATQAQAGHSTVKVTEGYVDPKKLTNRGRTHAADVIPRPDTPPMPEIQRRIF